MGLSPGTIMGYTSRVQYYEYNGSGQPTRHELDELIDGAIDETDRFEYDGSGRLSARVSTTYLYDPVNPDMVAQMQTSRTGYEYDAEHRLVAEELDVDDDGAIEERTVHSYEGDTRTLSEVFDGEGMLVSRTSYSYEHDAEGNLLSEEVDEGDDGMLEERIEYDVQGRIAHRETRMYDIMSATGVPIDVVEVLFDYMYDAEGRLEAIAQETFVTLAGDTRIEGSPPPCTHEYSYNADGSRDSVIGCQQAISYVYDGATCEDPEALIEEAASLRTALESAESEPEPES